MWRFAGFSWLCLAANAQHVFWTFQTGTSGYVCHYAQIDSSDNLVLAGYTEGSLGGNTNARSNDIVVMKLDSQGLLHWTFQTGTSVSDWAESVDIDDVGNIS